ncbi:hypothetical protein BDQ94DRAFT_152281, partial [Aspergillus welwitschiae]
MSFSVYGMESFYIYKFIAKSMFCQVFGEWQLGVPTAEWVGMPHGMLRFFSVFSLVCGFSAGDRILVINEWSAAFILLIGVILFTGLPCALSFVVDTLLIFLAVPGHIPHEKHASKSFTKL